MTYISKNLMKLVNSEMERKNFSMRSFAVRCGLSYDEIRKISIGSIAEPRPSTIINICENSDITIYEVFGYTDNDKLEKENITLTIGANCYDIHVKKIRTSLDL